MISTLRPLKLFAPFSFHYPCPRKLREIVKMSLLERQSSDRITDIWKEYHSIRTENIATTLSLAQHNTLKTQAAKAPMFLLPVKREGGHFKLLSQWQQNSVLFTYLQDFKKKGSSAAPYYVVTLFEQLALMKQLVLVRGDILSFQLTRPQAQKVWDDLVRVYNNPQIFQLALNFNHNAHLFNQKKYNEIFDL